MDFLREGLKKTYWGKLWSFAKPGGGGGGGGQQGWWKTKLLFWKSIFQRVSRIILGPSNHVLHLVWSVYFISTAVRTALKVAWTPQIMGERRPLWHYKSHYKSKKRIDFELGPSVKFVSPNKGLISKKKMGVNFLRRENNQRGGCGGPRGGLAKDHNFPQYVFLRPSLRLKIERCNQLLNALQ